MNPSWYDPELSKGGEAHGGPVTATRDLSILTDSPSANWHYEHCEPHVCADDTPWDCVVVTDLWAGVLGR